jgi:hypothetical protein
MTLDAPDGLPWRNPESGAIGAETRSTDPAADGRHFISIAASRASSVTSKRCHGVASRREARRTTLIVADCRPTVAERVAIADEYRTAGASFSSSQRIRRLEAGRDERVMIDPANE